MLLDVYIQQNKKEKKMRTKDEEILLKVDATLDQLINNANVINQISKDAQLADELSALEKTQESLLAHLLHMQSLLDRNESKSQAQPPSIAAAKISHLEQLSEHFQRSYSKKRQTQRPVIRKNRKRAKIFSFLLKLDEGADRFF
jgi:hypothetical protein